MLGPFSNQMLSHWERLKGYAVGAWGNLCKAELPSKGENAAHDQITERKASIACFRISFAYDSRAIRVESR